MRIAVADTEGGRPLPCHAVDSALRMGDSGLEMFCPERQDVVDSPYGHARERTQEIRGTQKGWLVRPMSRGACGEHDLLRGVCFREERTSSWRVQGQPGYGALPMRRGSLGGPHGLFGVLGEAAGQKA